MKFRDACWRLVEISGGLDTPQGARWAELAHRVVTDSLLGYQILHRCGLTRWEAIATVVCRGTPPRRGVR